MTGYSIPEAVQQALDVQRAADADKQARVDELRRRRRHGWQSCDRPNRRAKRSMRQRNGNEAERQEKEQAAVKRRYRSLYAGSDAQFEAAWPTIYAQVIAGHGTGRRVPTF